MDHAAKDTDDLFVFLNGIIDPFFITILAIDETEKKPAFFRLLSGYCRFIDEIFLGKGSVSLLEFAPMEDPEAASCALTLSHSGF